MVADERLEALRLLGHEDREALAVPTTREAHRDLDADLFADPLEAEDDLVERRRDVGQIDSHAHDEEPLDDALLDVLDVDVLAGEIRRDARDDPLLIAADDRDDASVLHDRTV